MYASPLRPAPQDIAHYRAEIAAWTRAHGVPRTLILGVTPELHDLGWPAEAELLALDASPDMIAQVWPGRPDQVRCADWRHADLPPASRDLILCDGGLILLDYPGGQHDLVRMAARTLTRGGLFLLRLYLPASVPDDPEAVLSDLLAGKFGGSSAFRLRLFTAMQRTPEEGVALCDVYAAIHAVAPDPDELARRTDWPREHQRMIDVFRGNPARLHYPNADGVRDMFCRDPGGFELQQLHFSDYEMGERCPLAVFRRL